MTDDLTPHQFRAAMLAATLILSLAGYLWLAPW